MLLSSNTTNNYSTMSLLTRISPRIPQHLIDLIYEYESSSRHDFSNSILPEINLKCIACKRTLSFEFCVTPFVHYVCSIACDQNLLEFWEQVNNPQYAGQQGHLLEDEDEEQPLAEQQPDVEDSDYDDWDNYEEYDDYDDY